MISQTAEYALRAVVRLASEPDAPLTTQQIAARAHVPAPFLAKVMQSLARAGIVKSRRGLRGGFALASRADELALLDVVNAVDPLRRIRACPLGLSEHAGHLCPLHTRLDEALAMVEASFRETTVADLLSTPRRRKSCRFPQVATSGAP